MFIVFSVRDAVTMLLLMQTLHMSSHLLFKNSVIKLKL